MGILINVISRKPKIYERVVSQKARAYDSDRKTALRHLPSLHFCPIERLFTFCTPIVRQVW